MKAIIGKKVGMTQLFTEDGAVVAVTVIEAGPCPVVRVEIEANVVTPAAAAARNSRSRSSALNFGRTERWLAWVLTTGTSSSTTSSPGIAREHLLDRGHDARQRRRAPATRRACDRMHEERPQIVEPLGEEFGDRVSSNGIVPYDFS